MKKASQLLNPKRSTRRKSINHSEREVRSKVAETNFILDELREKGINTDRPKSRCECPVQRPCPFVGCQYHLYLDITDTGSIKYNFYGLEPSDLNVSCALDVADENNTGELSFTEIGRNMGLTRERIRQIEKSALKKLKEFVGEDREWMENL